MDISTPVKIMLAVRCGRCEPEKVTASLVLPLYKGEIDKKQLSINKFNKLVQPQLSTSAGLINQSRLPIHKLLSHLGGHSNFRRS